MNEENEYYQQDFEPPIYLTSCKTRAEEQPILDALLTGEREPKTDEDKFFIEFVGFRDPRASWASQWQTCRRCGAEWKVTGIPAPGSAWFYPSVCRSCDDYLSAKPIPAPKEEEPAKKKKSPYKED